MRKIFIPLAVLAALTACKKKEAAGKDATLQQLIAQKDVKGLEQYRDRQKAKLDSMNKIMSGINNGLSALGEGNPSGTVASLKMAQTQFVHNVDIQGNVTTDQDITITPQFNGVLTLYVKEGQRVSRGQVIGRVADGGLNDQYKQAQIQTSAANAQLAQAKASMNLAKITFEKQSKLWSQKIGSEIQYLQAKTNYESAQKQVAAMQSQVSATQKNADYVKANLDKTAIVAPFSGVVDKIYTQSGQVVSMAPASQILKLISLGTMRVEADVPESYLAHVRPGTAVKIFFPNLNRTVESRVRLVGNYINPQTRTFSVQIPVPSEDGLIKPNSLAQLKIETYMNPSAYVVPQQYIYEDGAQKNYVFVATNIQGVNATAKKVIITEGEKSENNVEITSGLKTGDIVLTDGSKNLTDGQKITLAN